MYMKGMDGYKKILKSSLCKTNLEVIDAFHLFVKNIKEITKLKNPLFILLSPVSPRMPKPEAPAMLFGPH